MAFLKGIEEVRVRLGLQPSDIGFGVGVVGLARFFRRAADGDDSAGEAERGGNLCDFLLLHLGDPADRLALFGTGKRSKQTAPHGHGTLVEALGLALSARYAARDQDHVALAGLSVHRRRQAENPRLPCAEKQPAQNPIGIAACVQ